VSFGEEITSYMPPGPVDTIRWPDEITPDSERSIEHDNKRPDSKASQWHLDESVSQGSLCVIDKGNCVIIDIGEERGQSKA
jgi:hypothetical protein